MATKEELRDWKAATLGVNKRAYLYFEECAGCPEGHSSFWKTIVESPQWQAWGKKIAENFHEALEKDRYHENPEVWKNADIWDWDECTECGFISQKHFQSFLKFCIWQQPKSD
jgi:hypothetical protein